jgi:hypothetical protein
MEFHIEQLRGGLDGIDLDLGGDADDFHLDIDLDEDFDLEQLYLCLPRPRPATRRPVQTDDWCRPAFAPEVPLCSCCAAATLG